MRPTAPFRLNRSGMMLAILSAAFATETSAAAGRAEFTIGGVTVARGGVERPLARGTELDNGDVVRTNDGRAQIRFTDGAYVSLQPNTEYGIRDYQYTQGNERGFFSLLKGAMRTVTGAIGRINRDRYQIATPTATVGIRGTGGVIQVQDDGSTLVVGTSGIWSLTNPAGSVDVPAGTSAVAPSDPNQPPQESTQQPSSGPAPVPPEETQFTQGEEVDEQGLPVIPTPSLLPLASGSGYTAALAWSFSSSPNVDLVTDGTAVFNASSQMTSLSSSFEDYILVNGSVVESGNDGIIAWGRWIGDVSVPADGQLSDTYGQNQGLHYVIGIPTATLPASGTATYSILGATSPTYTDGTASPGTFSGSLTVDFGLRGSGITANFNVAIGGTSYGLAGTTSTTTVFAMTTADQSLSVSGCLSSPCSGLVAGFFAGSTAERAGVSYHIGDPNIGKDILGAAAFKKD
jgi:hypothetical protein